jgi:hypothetical protein
MLEDTQLQETTVPLRIHTLRMIAQTQTMLGDLATATHSSETTTEVTVDVSEALFFKMGFHNQVLNTVNFDVTHMNANLTVR